MRVAKLKELAELDDPRPLDRAVFNRLRLMVEHEACHPAWGCILYRLHRLGRIDNDEREAGDRYYSLVLDHYRLQATDPDEMVLEARDLAYRRVNRAKRRFNEVIEALGVYRKAVDRVIFEELWPTSERNQAQTRIGLSRLKFFFSVGTKSERNMV